MRQDSLHILVAIKELFFQLEHLRKEIDELRDDVKCIERMGGGVQFVFREPSPAESETESVQSAPPTVSYDRDDE